MYCSTCGVAVAQGLTYCNYCGARLNVVKADDSDATVTEDFQVRTEVKPELVVSAMAGVFILGLVAITMLMGMMKSVLELPVELVLAFALLPFSIMLLLEGVFIRLLWRRKSGINERGGAAQSKGQSTKELDAAHARKLPEGVPSVTEHTTRAFDPIYTERTSK